MLAQPPEKRQSQRGLLVRRRRPRHLSASAARVTSQLTPPAPSPTPPAALSPGARNEPLSPGDVELRLPPGQPRACPGPHAKPDAYPIPAYRALKLPQPWLAR